MSLERGKQILRIQCGWHPLSPTGLKAAAPRKCQSAQTDSTSGTRFVHEPDARDIGTVRYARIEPVDDESAKKLAKRTLTNLYNERPAWLATAHAKLDAAVAEAYGFPANLTDEQVLERLLALNLERAAAEAANAKKTPKKPASRAKAEDELI